MDIQKYIEENAIFEFGHDKTMLYIGNILISVRMGKTTDISEERYKSIVIPILCENEEFCISVIQQHRDKQLQKIGIGDSIVFKTDIKICKTN